MLIIAHCSYAGAGQPRHSSEALFNLRRECSPCINRLSLTTIQYAYSILSIVSGLFAFFVTLIVAVFSGAVSLARLDIQKIPISFVSNIFEPSLAALNAALMVDHDNTNPIKFMALEWFRNRLNAIRKAEVC